MVTLRKSLFFLLAFLTGLWPHISALSQAATGTVAVSIAPTGDRVALVIGNSAYASQPLVNPKNDAIGMTQLLQSAGFTVDRQLDATQVQLKAAVDKFGAAIRDPKIKFAMFYYAGHGVQLDWRNYLIPVNARVRSADDVRKQTVDVSDLLRYMEESKGKSFLVILDACRDDPFAGTYQTGAKGLSQFDAPVGSLLAFSTSPGNVALDGDGKNGLYTSHLLREFGVRGVKIEDAFKRVRLNVRLASKGAQIPWESTSLEEDVYLFPSEKRKLSEADQNKLFEQEVAHWLRVKSSTDTEVLANFLREYPSGSASELAQSRLNRLMTAQAALAAQQEAARLVAERMAADKLASEKLAAEKLAADKLAAERVAAERIAAERVAAERLAAEQEAARIAAQKREAERLAVVRIEQERVAAQQAESARQELARQELARQHAAQAEALRQQRVAEETRVSQANALATQQAAERAAQQALLDQQAREMAAARQREALALAQAQAKLQEQALEQARAAQAQAQAQRAEQVRMAAAQAQRDELARLAAAATLPPVPVLTVAAPLLLAAALPSQVSLPATPYYKGFAEHDRRYNLGDQFDFRVVNKTTQAVTPLSLQVSAVDAENDRIEFNQGEYLSDTMGNVVRNLRGGMSTPRQFYPAELFVGKKWRTLFKQSRPNGLVYAYYYDLKVVAKETITVPAGTFETYKIEARGYNETLGARLERNIWVAPGISADIAHETFVRLRNGIVDQNDRQELVALARARP
jgi:hypothetical protein